GCRRHGVPLPVRRGLALELVRRGDARDEELLDLVAERTDVVAANRQARLSRDRGGRGSLCAWLFRLAPPREGEGAAHPLVLPARLPLDGVTLDLALERGGGLVAIPLGPRGEGELAVLVLDLGDVKLPLAVYELSLEPRLFLGDGQR